MSSLICVNKSSISYSYFEISPCFKLFFVVIFCILYLVSIVGICEPLTDDKCSRPNNLVECPEPLDCGAFALPSGFNIAMSDLQNLFIQLCNEFTLFNIFYPLSCLL